MRFTRRGIQQLIQFMGDAEQDLPLWEFDLTGLTFTPAMGYRSAPGPFTAAPLHQGKRAGNANPDIVTFSRGAANLGGGWWNNFDPFQGTIVLWVTPEWDGTDARDHMFFVPHGGGDFRLHKALDSTLKFQTGGGTASVSVAGWTAGSTYCVVASWDINKTIDGTNYVRLSIDDVHSYQITSATIKSPASTPWIGSDQNSSKPANALLEGFTVYRRVLWDGAYGVDIGKGDELNLIYNAGSGTDPAAITGSWGIVFARPSDQKVNDDQVTGTGDAWSHPHGSNLLSTGRGFAITDWASAGWTNQGSFAPTSINSGTDFDALVGSDASIDDVMSADCTLEGWFRYDSGADQRAMFGKWDASSSGYGLRTTVSNSIDSIGFRVYLTSGSGNLDKSGTGLKIGQWFHIAITYDFSTRFCKMWINGIGATSATFGADPASDAADILFLGATGDTNRSWQGGIGWIRFSDIIRYSDFFIPPARTTYPETDANTIEQWNFDDGVGATVTSEVVGANNAALTGTYSWDTVRDMDVESPGHRTFNWGYTIAGYDNVILTEDEFPLLTEDGEPLLEE